MVAFDIRHVSCFVAGERSKNVNNLTVYVSGWVILALIVIGLALYRKFLSAHEEDRYLHLAEGETKQIPHQIAVNQKITLLDRVGEFMTIFTLIAGIALACLYVYARL
jgi:hypothetical protein